jgi:hypothetical protein
MIVSDEFIVERVEVDERELGRDSAGVQLRYNQIEPSIITDGVDVIAVIDEGNDKYRVDFWGYASGRMYIDADGVQELGQKLTSNEDEIPVWTLDPETIDGDDPPWWIPESVDIEPTVTCDNCTKTVSARDVFTPRNLPPSIDGPIVCQACWDRR